MIRSDYQERDGRTNPSGPGTRTIDSAPEYSPREAVPTAQHGQTIPVVYGTARVSAPLIVFQRAFGAIQGHKNWNQSDGWARYDTVGMRTVLALAEAPITGITRFWRDGSEAFDDANLDYLGAGYGRTVAAGSGTSTINFTSPLPVALTPGGRIVFTSGSLVNQPKWIASSTTTSVTVTVPWASGPAVGDAFYITDGYTIQTSETPGTPISWLEGDAVGMGFGGTAYYACRTLAAKEDGKIPAIRFEIAGRNIDPTDGVNANPADVALDLLTNPRFGVGLSTNQIEVELGPNGLASSGYRAYCASMGLLVSRAVTEREEARELLASLLACTNSVAVCTGGKIKIIPRGDTAIGSYVPPSTSAVLDDNEILREGSSDPVTIRRTPDQDVFNAWPVTILNRDADWEASEYEDEDTSHSATYGQRRAPGSTLPWITRDTVAKKISSLWAQRSIYSRNTYRFRVKPRWALLEPMDYVSVSHTVGGLSNVLCRILTIRRLSDGALEIEAEEAPLGSAHPVDLTPATQDGYATVAPAPKYIGDASSGPIDPSRITEISIDPANLTLGTETFAGIPVIGRAHVSTFQAIYSSETRINFNTEDVDTHNAITTGASWVFTVPTGKAGHYLVHARATVRGQEVSGVDTIKIYKSGTEYAASFVQSGNTAEVLCMMPSLAAAATIYATLHTTASAPTGQMLIEDGFFEIWRVQLS